MPYVMKYYRKYSDYQSLIPPQFSDGIFMPKKSLENLLYIN